METACESHALTPGENRKTPPPHPAPIEKARGRGRKGARASYYPRPPSSVGAGQGGGCCFRVLRFGKTDVLRILIGGIEAILFVLGGEASPQPIPPPSKKASGRGERGRRALCH